VDQPLSDHHKRNKNIISNKKAFSSIVGAIFAVLVIVSLTGTFFVWSLQQNTRYVNAVAQMNQLEIDQMSESVKVLDINYSVVSENHVNVKGNIQNNGPSSVQFVNLWVYVSDDVGGQTYFNFSNIDSNIEGGKVYAIDKTVVVNGIHSGGLYYMSSSMITARGNRISLPKVAAITNTIITAQTTDGIGALAMSFQDFIYYTVTGSTLNNFPSGSSGYSVTSGGSNIAFRVILTNYDRNQRQITLNSSSVFFSIFPTLPQQVRGAYWYIVNVNANGIISNTFTSVVLPFNVPTAVYFASDHAITPGNPYAGAKPLFTGTAPINLAVIGRVGTSPFGQNIPFVSIIINS